MNHEKNRIVYGRLAALRLGRVGAENTDDSFVGSVASSVEVVKAYSFAAQFIQGWCKSFNAPQRFNDVGGETFKNKQHDVRLCFFENMKS